MCEGQSGSRSVASDSGLQPARVLCPWGFSRREYWSGLPFPPPGDLPDPGIELASPALQADSLLSEPPGKSMSYSQVKMLSYLKRETKYTHTLTSTRHVRNQCDAREGSR